MNYFQLKPYSSNLPSKELIINYLIPCHKDDPDFLGNHNNDSKIEFAPKVPKVEISNERRLPSVFYAGGMLSTRLIISNQLKEIIEEANTKSAIQFFQITLLQKNKEINDYWITNYSTFNDNCIDFDESTFISVSSKSTGNPYIQVTFTQEYENKKFLDFGNYKTFKDELKLKNGSISPEKIYIKKNCNQDILFLKDVFIMDIIISENFKNRILEEKIFDIEFKPLEISDEEWYGPNSLRKQFYN